MARNQVAIDRDTSGEARYVEPVDTSDPRIIGNSTSFGIVNSAENDILRDFGIRPYSPEILLMSNFITSYTKISSNNGIFKNSNFDFMVFQTQFDLAIKEIINQKIENTEDLKQRILEKYKDTLSRFDLDKKTLNDFYINVLSVLNSFEIDQIKSKFKISSINENRASQDLSSIMSDFKKVGFEFSEDTLKGSLLNNIDNSISGELLSADEFLGNKLYKNMFRMVFDTYFGYPNYNFKKSSPFLSHTFYKTEFKESKNEEISEKSDSFQSKIIIASRMIQNLFKNNESIGYFNSISSHSLESQNPTFESWMTYGKNVMGDYEVSTSGEDSIFGYSNIFTADRQNIQVFNKIIDFSEKINIGGTFATINENNINIGTGREYFTRDVISNLSNGLSGNSFDLKKYVENLKSKNINLLQGLMEYYKKSSYSYSYKIVKEVLKLTRSAFYLDNLDQNDSDIIATNPIDVLNGLQAIYSIVHSKILRIEIIEGIGSCILIGIQPGTLEEINNVFIPLDVLGANIALIVINPENDSYSAGDVVDLAGNKISSQSFDDLLSVALGSSIENRVNGSQYDLIKSGRERIVLNTLTLPSRYILKIGNLIKGINTSIINGSNYLSPEFVVSLALESIKIMFKDFHFYYLKGESAIYIRINKEGLNELYAMRDIVENNEFQRDRLSSQKIAGKSRNEANTALDRMEYLFKKTSYPIFASFNVVYSVLSYLNGINDKINKIKSNIENINQIFSLTDLGLSDIGVPSIEKITNLNHGYKKIYSPTTSFNENTSYFSYLNTRTSNDMIALNHLHKMNPLLRIIDPNNEGIRFAAIGIPDGLINKLRYDSGRTEDHCIVELSLLVLDHKFGNSPGSTCFTKQYRYIFNTCLHVDTINPEIDIFSNYEKYEDILNIDNRNDFQSYSINEENLLSFNFGNIKNESFSITTKRKIEDAILFNKSNYKISSNPPESGAPPEYIFNNTMSKDIIANHINSYIIKRNLELYNGVSFDEINFPYIPRNDIATNFQNGTLSDSSKILINYFENSSYSNDLKDYLKRTSAYSPIINPELFRNESFNISKFDRIFFIPCFESRINTTINQPEMKYEDHFSFQTIVPVLRLL